MDKERRLIWSFLHRGCIQGHRSRKGWRWWSGKSSLSLVYVKLKVPVLSWLVFFSVRLFSVLHGHSVFPSPPQRPMTSNLEGFLYQILSNTLFSYLNYILNFIYFTTITKPHARWHRCLRSDGLRVSSRLVETLSWSSKYNGHFHNRRDN